MWVYAYKWGDAEQGVNEGEGPPARSLLSAYKEYPLSDHAFDFANSGHDTDGCTSVHE